MKVREAMTKSPASCSLNTNLGAATEIMWTRNCGFLPVLDAEQKVVGVVTDRDMCIAMATRNRLPGEITVQQVISGVIYSCKADDDVSTALETMDEKGVRRLPVLDAAGKLAGVLSIDDLVLKADSETRGSLSSEDVVHSLRKLYSSQLGGTRSKAASA